MTIHRNNAVVDALIKTGLDRIKKEDPGEFITTVHKRTVLAVMYASKNNPFLPKFKFRVANAITRDQDQSYEFYEVYISGHHAPLDLAKYAGFLEGANAGTRYEHYHG
jgi:hypothetical protein